MASHTPHVHHQPQPLVDTHDPPPPPPPHFHWGVTTRPCSVTATNWQQAHPKSPRAQPCQHSVKTVDIFKKTHSSTATEIHGFSPHQVYQKPKPLRGWMEFTRLDGPVLRNWKWHSCALEVAVFGGCHVMSRNHLSHFTKQPGPNLHHAL